MRRLDFVMRAVGILATLAVAWALGLGCDDVLAQTQGRHVVQSMTTGTDPQQLQSAAWAWIVATASSTQFMVGAAAGLVLAEALRFLWRSFYRVLGGALNVTNFLIQHRLAVVIAGAAVGYAAMRFIA